MEISSLKDIPGNFEETEFVYDNSLPQRDWKLNLYLYLLGVPHFGRRLSPRICSYFKGTQKAALMPGFKCLYGNFIVGREVALHDSYCLDYAPIVLGDYVSLSSGRSMLLTSTHDFNDFKRVIARPIVIERNAWIASGCIILGGVRIGENTVVGAGSVVTESLPPNVLAAGNPAKVIREIQRNSPGADGL